MMIYKYYGDDSIYSIAVAEEGLPLVAVLEDMAQTLGYRLPVMSSAEFEANSDANILEDINSLDGAETAGVLVMADAEENSFLAIKAESEEAAERIRDIIEKNSRAIIEGESIGGAIPLDEELAVAQRKVYLEDYSKREKENVLTEERPFPLAAEAVVDLSESLMSLGYLKGTRGNLSLRFGKNNMLITPSGRSYIGMTGADIVKVNIETCEWEGDLIPSSEKDLHRLIFQAFPEARVIIHTHGPNSSVFAAARTPLELTGGLQWGEEDEEAEAKTYEGILPIADFAPAGTMELAENVVKAMKTPGAIRGALMSNHGLVCFGEDITDAFDLCRSIEEEAERTLNV